MANNSLNKTIGNRINSLLAEQNKTQKALADFLGVKPNEISYICSGTRTPNTERIVKIAEFFNVSADYLLGIQKEKTQSKDVVFICDYTGLSEHSVGQLHLTFAKGNQSNFFETLNWLIENSYMDKIVDELCNLKMKSSLYLDLKNKKIDSYVHNERQSLYVRDCDVIRLNLFRLINHLSDQFDQREQVNENGEYNPPKE